MGEKAIRWLASKPLTRFEPTCTLTRPPLSAKPGGVTSDQREPPAGRKRSCQKVLARLPRSPIAKSAHDPAAVVIDASSGALVARDDGVEPPSLLALAPLASRAVIPTAANMRARSK
jgi:hypothetical protein